MNEKTENNLDLYSLEFSEGGKELINKIGVIEIFYYNSEKDIIRKNRIRKNRVMVLKKIRKHTFQFHTPKYWINLHTFWDNIFKLFILYEKTTIEKNFKKFFKKILKKNKIKPLNNDKIKVQDISLLPKFDCVLDSNLNKLMIPYFEKVRKKLKHKKNFYFILRQAETYHSMEIRVENKNYTGKNKKRKEIKVGDDYNRDRKKYVSLKRVIDRDNDLYGEKIIDESTGEIIRECYEPLKDHQGRGNAKYK